MEGDIGMNFLGSRSIETERLILRSSTVLSHSHRILPLMTSASKPSLKVIGVLVRSKTLYQKFENYGKKSYFINP